MIIEKIAYDIIILYNNKKQKEGEGVFLIYISICDDDKKMAEKLRTFILKKFSAHGYRCQFRIYQDKESFYQNYQEEDPELIFLNMEMPGVTGMQIAEYLKEKRRNRNMILISGNETFDFQYRKYVPLAFIGKDEVMTETGALIEEVLACIKQKAFIVKMHHKIHRICLEDIMYLDYWKHQILLVAARNQRYQFCGSLKECEQQLCGECFFRVNSGTIVNLDYVKELNSTYIIMEDQKQIVVSREKRKMFREKFINYQRKRGNITN